MTVEDKSEGPRSTQRVAYHLWALAAGLVLGLAAILSLPHDVIAPYQPDQQIDLAIRSFSR